MENNTRVQSMIQETKEVELRLLVKFLLKMNMSNERLARMTRIDPNRIEDLLMDDEAIVYIFNKEENKINGFENLDTNRTYGEYILSEVRKRRSKENRLQIDLSRLYSDPEQQRYFLISAVLTFRISLHNVSELLGLDEDAAYKYLVGEIPGREKAFYYLFKMEVPRDNEGKDAFLSYYKKILFALENRDLQAVQELLSVIRDEKAIKIARTRKPGDSISEDDIAALVAYQLKYSCSANEMSGIFKVSRHNYADRVRMYLKDKPELAHRFELLVDYNYASYNKHEWNR